MGRLTAKVALVTGGASGIGRASCEALAREGASVLVADINNEGAQATAERIGPAAASHTLDVSNETDWEAATARAIELFGRLDIVVNCAGIGITGTVEDMVLEEWNRVLAVNLTGTMLACKHGIRAIRQSDGGGSLINISSIGALLGTSDLPAYGASKAGVTLLSKSVAMDCAERGYGIRCNAIHPTYVDTEMLDPIAEMVGDRDAMVAGMVDNVPLGRLATPQDIANSVVFLASEESAMITGTAFLVDGGTTAGMPSKHSQRN
ncbi:glucose 1-dehydrogenase [Haliea sp. E1-2-M8]|nr:glucose 1-dehydrogenase [Haliea sp. E1-2-M8]